MVLETKLLDLSTSLLSIYAPTYRSFSFTKLVLLTTIAKVHNISDVGLGECALSLVRVTSTMAAPNTLDAQFEIELVEDTIHS